VRRGTRAIGGAMCLPDAIWRTQYRELLRLRVLSARRDLKVTLSQIFIGAFACILLSFFQLLANNILGSSTPHYAPTPVGAIPKCETGPGVLRPALSGNASEPGCFTLLYAPASPQVAALVRAAVARSPGLAVGDDVAPVPGLVPFPAPAKFHSFVNASLFAGGGDGATCASAAAPVTGAAAPNTHARASSGSASNRTTGMAFTPDSWSREAATWASRRRSPVASARSNALPSRTAPACS
jgi:hypothetical protein